MTSTSILEPETERLMLRQWKDSDKAPFAALNADSRVMEFFPSVLSRSESDAVADHCGALIAERGWGFWAVESKATGDFLGFLGLHIPSDDLPFSPCVEIGWRLAFDYWGKGYATEAAREALRVGFEVLALRTIVSFTTTGNQRSRAVMRRLGMNMTDTFEHPAVPRETGLRQHCLYSINRDQYETTNRLLHNDG